MINLNLDYNTLAETFRSGFKSPSDLQVGVEWEKLGIHRETGAAIPYSGPRGVRAIFEALESRFDWVPILSGTGEPIAMKKGPVGITLEPGGQIELSGQKAVNLVDNAAELHLHLAEIHEVSAPLDIAWLGIGAQPFSTQEEIEWVPKERYAIMRESLKERGALTYSMMKETASVQVSLDYVSETDAVEKLRLAFALSPVLTALFANSPLERGERSRWLSRRARIWLDTDPARSGVLWDVFKPDYSFDDYVRYALDVPVLFIQRGGKWIGLPPMSFAEFAANGWNGLEPEPADWQLHLTSIFTEARLKNYLEIRSIDCQTAPMSLAAVAFVKGLFYDERSRRAAWRLFEDLTLDERKELRERAPETALKTPFKSRTLLHPSEALLEMAESGLGEGERKFLTPLKELLKTGRCPAERLLECGHGSSYRRSKVDQVVACACIF